MRVVRMDFGRDGRVVRRLDALLQVLVFVTRLLCVLLTSCRQRGQRTLRACLGADMNVRIRQWIVQLRRQDRDFELLVALSVCLRNGVTTVCRRVDAVRWVSIGQNGIGIVESARRKVLNGWICCVGGKLLVRVDCRVVRGVMCVVVRLVVAVVAVIPRLRAATVHPLSKVT